MRQIFKHHFGLFLCFQQHSAQITLESIHFLATRNCLRALQTSEDLWVGGPSPKGAVMAPALLLPSHGVSQPSEALDGVHAVAADAHVLLLRILLLVDLSGCSLPYLGWEVKVSTVNTE